MVELIITMVVGGILGLVMTIQFVAEQQFRTAINNEIASGRDAFIALHDMTNVLRFAMPTDLDVATQALPYTVLITAKIKGGCLLNNPVYNILNVDNYAYYRYDAENDTIEQSYDSDWAKPNVIARNVTGFDAQWAAPYLTLEMTTQGAWGTSVSLQTQIRPIGGDQ